jgi:hypothetical protein
VDSLPKEPVVLGTKLHDLTGPEEGILLLNPLDARDAYYVDRAVKDGINRLALFQEALRHEIRFRYFVVPISVYRAHPRKPLFQVLGSTSSPYTLGEFYIFDLSPLSPAAPRS